MGRGITREGVSPLLRGVRGISPKKNFDIWLPLCAFLSISDAILARISAALGCFGTGRTCISIMDIELSIQSQDKE